MTIDAHTKIAALLKFQPKALEAIVDLSPRFEKLRNPLLRKLMASRTTIAMAAKIGGCSVADFYRQLIPFGFKANLASKDRTEASQPLPQFMQKLDSSKIIDLDVRPILASGKDPLNNILQHTKALTIGYTLKIINTFEPTPLIQLLQQKGFSTYTRMEADGVVATYFYKNGEVLNAIPNSTATTDWNAVFERYKNKLQTVDVRTLPMPLPMHTILEKLEDLPFNAALYVYHKKVPLFLLPELAEGGFEICIKEINTQEVHLLIYKA